MDEKRSSIALRHHEQKCLFIAMKHDRLEATFRAGLARMRLTETGAAKRLHDFAGGCCAQDGEGKTGCAEHAFVETRGRDAGERVQGECAAALGWLEGRVCPRMALAKTMAAGRGLEAVGEESGQWEAPPEWLDEVEVRWRCFSDPEWDRRRGESGSEDEEGSDYGDGRWGAPARWVCYTPDTEVGSWDGESAQEDVGKDELVVDEPTDGELVIEKAMAQGLFALRTVAEASNMGSPSGSKLSTETVQC
ncbi:hypothetical protein B0H67DRAFT_587766 [Lasiosphaeris hirsuta]|uniref:Uncharacterized protein n=1 Tax=Lasiosphaeris hirsuta TaxID=260670 RepID=A0AA40A1B3_9PEZI|nr:hypothetical protein B0H67DRAFT_587766 [Lasiosphaeris hirsuta]